MVLRKRRGKINGQASSQQRYLITASATILVILQLLLASNAQEVKIEGWQEVKKEWPIGESNYFLATEKGHHFIEVRLPDKLNADLMVSLEYYYSYSRVEPVIQMTPCDANIFIVNATHQGAKNKWTTHRYRVSKFACARRNELAYNVLLHDAGDVFVWKYMRISIIQGSQGDTAPTSATTEIPNEISTAQSSSEAITTTTVWPRPYELPTSTLSSETITTTTVRPRPNESPTSTLSSEAITTTTVRPRPYESPTNASGSEANTTTTVWPRPYELPRVTTLEPTTSTTLATTTTTTEKPTTTTEWSTEANVPTPKKDTTSSTTTKEDDTTQSIEETEEFFDELLSKKPEDNLRRLSSMLQKSEKAMDNTLEHRERQLARFRRNAESDHNHYCRPSSCDRNLFKMARFIPLVKGLPKISDDIKLDDKDGFKYYMRIKDEPLQIKLESDSELFEEVDTCIDFKLFMDEGSEVEFALVNDEHQKQSNKSSFNSSDSKLEVLRGKALGEESAADSGWTSFRRCMSNYMPHYVKPNNRRNTLQFKLTPLSSIDKRIAVLVDRQRAANMRAPFPLLKYLPDISSFTSKQTLDKYWLIDLDGVSEPTVSFVRATSSKRDAYSQLKIGFNDTQEHIDITSRWLKIKDAEIIENPIMFVYEADRADWIKKVEFDFQRAGDPPDTWLNQTAYAVDKKQKSSGAGISSSDGNTITGSKSEATAADGKNVTGQGGTKTRRDSNGSLALPIRLKGLDSSEFRIRVRHYLEKGSRITSGGAGTKSPRELVLHSLAFADICSIGGYCRNNGACKPSGTATADCICKEGYSGKRCQNVSPCDVRYGGLLGAEICSLIGARCVPNLPVLRCRWPNDQYYHCTALFQEETSSNSTMENDPKFAGGLVPIVPVAPIDMAISNMTREEAVSHLQGKINEQRETIIILSVFMVAGLLFAAVLIISMVSRLQKSKSRLQKSLSDTHELARRVQQPGPSNAKFGPGRPTNGMRPFRGNVNSYSNSAFDVE